MSNNTKIYIHPELRKAVEEDNLVLFIGAGLSYNFKNKAGEELKGWNNLIDSIVDFLSNEGYKADFLKPLVGKYDPIKILDLIETSKEGFIGSDFKGFVKHFFELSDKDNDFSLHKKLCELCNIIITTNYDNAFEIADDRMRSCKAYSGRNYELATHRERGAKLLFKLHGCIESADSMVVFSSEYKKLYENKSIDPEHALWTLWNIIYNKTVLFIGTGMGDFQITKMFKQVGRALGKNNQKHFIISIDKHDSSLDFLTHIPISSYDEIPPYIDELLKVKAYKKESDPMSLKLKESEERIKELTLLVEKEQNDNKRNKLKLEREAEKYLQSSIDLYISCDYLKAIEESNSAIELSPNSYKPFGVLGVSLIGLADLSASLSDKEKYYKDAIYKFEKAISINSKDYSSYNNWGLSLLKLADLSGSLDDKKNLYKDAIYKFEKAISINPEDFSPYNNWGLSLTRLADISDSLSDKERYYKEAIDKFEISISINPEDFSSYNNWGLSLTRLADISDSLSDKERYYKEAIDKFEIAVSLNPKDFSLYNNWGLSLTRLADISDSLSDKERYYREAIGKFEESISINPEDCLSYNNWGVSLIGLADLSDSLSDKERYYKEAVGKFEIAVSLNPKDFSPYNNWGLSLTRLADISDSLYDKERYYREAIVKFEESISINPEDNSPYNNWGLSLISLADVSESLSDKVIYYKEAIVKLEIAVSLNPKDSSPYNNWGLSLLGLADISSSDEKEKLYNEAYEKFVLSLEKGGEVYDASKAFFSRDVEKAIRLLDKSLSSGEVDVDKVESDDYWKEYLDKEEVKEVLGRYRK